ncbi:MAG: STAS domain-containing protein [Burkholderiaceae bacterium]|nr:STAS domain-containing protein [Burkholderiaceae bacterium]
MAEPKDGESFFRKVVRFVANPATDWNELATRQDDSLDLERSELKAMVERKRRNDFVRKREFDTLRRLRRDGLSPEQLAALGGSSKVDDSEARLTEQTSTLRQEAGVKAKIDEIEQQMVGEGQANGSPSTLGSPGPTPAQPPVPARRAPPAEAAPRRQPPPPIALPSGFHSAPTEPLGLHSRPTRAQTPPVPAPPPPRSRPDPLDVLDQLPPLPDLDLGRPGHAASSAPRPAASLPPPMPPDRPGQRHRPLPPVAAPEAPPPRAAQPLGERSSALPRLDLDLPPPPPPRAPSTPAAVSRLAVEVSEVVHDPELDEAVIAFANADFDPCEQSLTALVRQGGPRRNHGETWAVLFDLFRATGQQAKFENLALDFVNLFGRSAPQWYSLPRLVAEAAADERPDTRGVQGDVGWVAPAQLDAEGVARLRSATLQLPLPWVLDWSELQQVQVDAAIALQQLLRQWAPQALDMRWLGADRLFGALQEAAPTGVRDADPAFWMARLEALRLVNRPDQFDEAAIDYCVTYEVSPPSWEAARCAVRCSGGSSASTSSASLSLVSEASSSFLESHLADEASPGHQVSSVELSGQLSGDIGPTLQQLDKRLGQGALVSVSCARLIRVDFIAAGDLLNWVLSKQGEGRQVSFTDAHRLVALFFGAMGINEHARVQVPRT